VLSLVEGEHDDQDIDSPNMIGVIVADGVTLQTLALTLRHPPHCSGHPEKWWLLEIDVDFIPRELIDIEETRCHGDCGKRNAPYTKSSIQSPRKKAKKYEGKFVFEPSRSFQVGEQKTGKDSDTDDEVPDKTDAPIVRSLIEVADVDVVTPIDPLVEAAANANSDV